MRFPFVVTLTAVVVMGLTGCQPVATELATPDITWISESESPLDSDPWLEAARAADLGLRLAYNAQDFTISQLTSTHSASSVQAIYEVFILRFVDGGATPQAFPGPAIWLPLEIVESEDGKQADVTVCNASESWLITAEGEATFELTNGRESTFRMGEDQQSGKVIVLETLGSSRVCDATGAAIGRFDPEPTVPETITESDVRAPLG